MNGKRIGSGILASLAGGVVFGIMMQMMGSMKMIAGMVHSESAAVGWLMHLMISAIFGITWLLFAGPKGGFVRGMIYGVVVWVFGPLVVMPMMTGMPLFTVNQMTLMSLMGHVIYGVVTGLVFTALVKQGTTDVKA